MCKNEIRQFLISCALQNKTVDYMELYQMVYGSFDGNDFRFSKLWRQLIAIGSDELKAGRPAINCLAVNNNKGSIPGLGVL